MRKRENERENITQENEWIRRIKLHSSYFCIFVIFFLFWSLFLSISTSYSKVQQVKEGICVISLIFSVTMDQFFRATHHLCDTNQRTQNDKDTLSDMNYDISRNWLWYHTQTQISWVAGYTLDSCLWCGNLVLDEVVNRNDEVVVIIVLRFLYGMMRRLLLIEWVT